MLGLGLYQSVGKLTLSLVRHEEFSLRVVISIPTFLERLCEEIGNPEPICRFSEAGNPMAATVDSGQFPQQDRYMDTRPQQLLTPALLAQALFPQV